MWGLEQHRAAYLTETLSGLTQREMIAAAIEEVTGGADYPAATIVGVTGLGALWGTCSPRSSVPPSSLWSPAQRRHGHAGRLRAEGGLDEVLLYSEVQHWPGKSPQRLYHEVVEQVVHADRLGFDAYSAIEHFFFPRFSISANPFALWSRLRRADERISFRTLGHVLPYHNPTVLASQIAMADILFERPLRVRRAAAATAGSPRRPGVPAPRRATATRSRSRSSSRRSTEERFSYDGPFSTIDDAHIVPRPRAHVPRLPGGTSDRTYELAAEHGWASWCRRSCRTRRSRISSTSTGRSAPSTAPSRTSSGSTPATSTRTATPRGARPRRGCKGFLAGNASPLVERREAPAGRRAEAAGYGFYTRGDPRELAETPYDEMIVGDIVWVGTPRT